MSKQKVFIEIPITSRLPEGGKDVTWIKKDGKSIWGHINKSTFFNGKKFKNIISYLSIEESMYIEKYTKIEEIVSWLEEKELNVFTDEELSELLHKRYVDGFEEGKWG